MKNVRIKKHKKFSLTQLSIIFAVLLILLAASIYYVIDLNKKELPSLQIEKDLKVLLFKADKADLISFTISPSNGIDYTILNKDAEYVLKDHPDFVLNYSIIEEMVESLIYLEAEKLLIEVEQMHLIDYGIDNSAVEVMANFNGNRSYSFKIGHRIPTDIPKDFGVFNNSGDLYAFGITLKDLFNQQMNWLHLVPDVNFTADLLDRVILENDKDRLILSRLEKDLWVLNEPFHYPVDKLKMNRVLSSISKMRFASFVDTASAESLRRYGLDHPRLTVTFLLAESTIKSTSILNGQSHVKAVEAQEMIIRIGDAIEGLGFYCQYFDKIYQASDLSMGFMLDLRTNNYLSQFPIDVPLNLVHSISFEQIDNEKSAYNVLLVEHILPNNQIAHDEQENILYDYYVLNEEAKEIDAEKFTKLYDSLSSIKALGHISNFSDRVMTSPILQVKINFLNENRIINFLPLDTLHAAIEVNGDIVHYTDIEKLNNILTQLSLLKE